MATVKKKGLGKGLDSLITDKVTKSDSTSSVKPKSEHAADAVMMEISKVEPNREQPRKKFDEDALLELSESIKQFGVLQPLLVQMDGYKVTVQPTVEGGTIIVADVDYKKLDFTMFPQKNQTHYSTSVDYAFNTPKEQVLPDMATKGFVCNQY